MRPLLAPVTGIVTDLTEVPDPVFSQGMMGPGLALDPVEDVSVVRAPVTGRLVKCFPHAFVIEDPCGLSILVHLGLDTIELDGRGFEVLAVQGRDVHAGDELIRWRPADVRASGRSALCPVVALEVGPEAVQPMAEAGDRIEAGEPLFSCL